VPEAATLGMLSDELGVSRERIRQIEVSAKTRIRELCA
jgi:DNA-directed RNA polymerase sigma subunit (sigma70/sigma32)